MSEQNIDNSTQPNTATQNEQTPPIKSRRQKIKHVIHHSHKWFRRLFWALAIIPAVLFMAFWGAIQFIDFNQYKPQLQKEFLQRTGHELQINGTIEVSVLPFVMTVKDIEVKNVPVFEQTNFASIEAVEIEMSLLELFLSRKIDIQGLELEKLEVFLITDRQGRHNWRFFEKNVKRNLPSPFRKVSLSSVSASEPTSRLSGEDWFLKTLISQNAEIHWRNELLNRQFNISDFDLMAFDIKPNQPFNVMTNFDYDTDATQTKFHVKLSSRLTISDHFQKWLLQKWQGVVQMNLPKELNIPEVAIQTEGESFQLDLDDSFLEVISAEVSSSKGNAVFDLRQSFGADAFSKGHLHSEHIDLRKWFRYSGLMLPDFVKKWVLSDVSITLDWVNDAKQLAIENIDMKWDQSRLTGKFWKPVVEDESLPQPVHFDLEIDQLDLDNYQALAKHAKAEKEATQKSPKAPKKQKPKLTQTYLPLALPIDFLQSLEAEGHLKINRLVAWGMTFTKVATTLLAQKGQLDFAPLDAQLYKGSLKSKLNINVNGKTPNYAWSGKTSGIDLEPFLNDGWQYKKLKGTYSGHFDLKTKGVNGRLLKQNLQGRFNSNLDSGAVTGIDLNKLLSGQSSKIKDETQFKSLTMSGKITQGEYQIKRFNAISDRFSSIGTGRINLSTAHLTGKLFITYRRPPATLNYLKGVEIPINLKGELGQVKWQVDLDKALNNPQNQQKLFDGVKQFIQKGS